LSPAASPPASAARSGVSARPSRLSAAFADAGRPLLVGYLPAGFPTFDGAVAAFLDLVSAGVDIVEVGLPYSDPLMDGATIQQAVEAALAAGTTPRDVLRTVEAVAATGVPTLVMTYWNPVERYGVDSFTRDLAAAGGAGAITPDLVPEESASWRDAMARAGLDPVFLVAPSSTDARIRAIAAVSRGFVYAASTMGVTGARDAVADTAAALVARVRSATQQPVAVGLGVSTGQQAAEVGGFADGVIVGSAFVRRLLDGQHLAPLAAELASGVRSVAPRGSPSPAPRWENH
jgi:tryptophan synthase alpha chain